MVADVAVNEPSFPTLNGAEPATDLTFSITLFGLCVYWIKHRTTEANWFRKLLLAGIGTFITVGMFLITLVDKWNVGGLVAISLTFLVVFFCYFIKRHYKNLQKQMQTLNNVSFKDELFDISKSFELLHVC